MKTGGRSLELAGRESVLGPPRQSRRYPGPGPGSDRGRRSPLLVPLFPGEQGLPLSTTGLAVTPAHCSHRWAIRTDLEAPPAPDAFDAYGPPGIALTRLPAAVLSENDIPELEEIRRNLGFADISEGRKGDRSFYWAGPFPLREHRAGKRGRRDAGRDAGRSLGPVLRRRRLHPDPDRRGGEPGARHGLRGRLLNGRQRHP